MSATTPKVATNWDRRCPQCGADVGQPCRTPNGDRYTTYIGTPKFHFKRQQGRKS